MTKPTPKPKTIKITYRGWQGHFICPCHWHLNTLIQLGRREIIVSTVGQMERPKYKTDSKPVGNGEDRWEEIGMDRKYETMVFKAGNGEFKDADVTQQLDFGGCYNDEKSAQIGHLKIVKQVCDFLTSTRK